jgi:hypothetical protein
MENYIPNNTENPDSKKLWDEMVQTLNSGQLPSEEDFGKLDKFKNDQLDSKWQTPPDTTATGSPVKNNLQTKKRRNEDKGGDFSNKRQKT